MFPERNCSRTTYSTSKSQCCILEGETQSSDAWRIAIDLNTNTYEEAISAIRTDLHLIEGQKQNSLPF